MMLCLLIPLSFVNNIVDERTSLQREAIGDITARWGSVQKVSGPALIILSL
jgi:inner membrane protein involved in colicin E2 resistance